MSVPTRIGGFGGDDGFRAAVRGFDAVLDATHPYAATMSERAARLCAETGTPHLRLARPPWPVEPKWHRHPTLDAAADALPSGARVLLTVGRGGAAPFLGRNLRLWARRVDPATDLPGLTWLVGRPGDVGSETDLMRRLAIGHLVTKNAGGAGRAKLDAATASGVAIHVVDRPPPVLGEETHDIDRAEAFLRAHADRRRA